MRVWLTGLDLFTSQAAIGKQYSHKRVQGTIGSDKELEKQLGVLHGSGARVLSTVEVGSNADNNHAAQQTSNIKQKRDH